MNCDFVLQLTVNDPKALVEAARAHPDALGIETEDFYQDDGEVDTAFCLAMLLDPGTLPGCSIHQHYVEETP